MQYIPTNIPFFKLIIKNAKRNMLSKEITNLLNKKNLSEEEHLLLLKYRDKFIDYFIDLEIYRVKTFSYLYHRNDYLEKLNLVDDLKKKVKSGVLLDPKEIKDDIAILYKKIDDKIPTIFRGEKNTNKIYTYLGLNAVSDMFIISSIIIALISIINKINNSIKKQNISKKKH